MLHLAPSILAADFKQLGEEIRTISQSGAEYIHIDVMDGSFVPSISFGMPVISSIRGCTDKTFDVHMMVQEPGRYITDIKDAGADLICVHAEACVHLDRTIQQVREAGLKVGVALNPATPIGVLDCILEQLDMVLLMSVNPGFGGQKFIPYTLEKIKKMRKICNERELVTDIQVDGGVTIENAGMLIDAGANILVAGSAVFKGNAEENVKAFMNIFKEKDALEKMKR